MPCSVCLSRMFSWRWILDPLYDKISISTLVIKRFLQAKSQRTMTKHSRVLLSQSMEAELLKPQQITLRVRSKESS